MGRFISGNEAGVDKRLISIIRTAAEASPYTVKITSGKRAYNPATGTPNHPGGWATDIQLSSDGGKTWHSQARTRAAAPPYQDFARYARAAQVSKYPELTNTFRWGGKFGGRWSQDNEHFDITPGFKGAMSRGNWDSIIAGHPVPPGSIPDTGSPTATAYTGGMPLTAAQRAAAGMAAAGTLRKGATDAQTGGAVTRLQRQLADAGINPGPVDGKYGRQTAAAVRQAERQFNLPTRDRGVAGPQVQTALARQTGGPPVAGGQFIGGNGVAPRAGIGRGSPLISPVPIAQNPLRGSSPDFSIADPGPPGQRLQAGGGVVTIPTGTGGGAVAASGGPMGWPGAGQPLADPPSQVVMTPHSLNSGVARGAPVPAPPVASGGVPVASAGPGGYPTAWGEQPQIGMKGSAQAILGRPFGSAPGDASFSGARQAELAPAVPPAPPTVNMPGVAMTGSAQGFLGRPFGSAPGDQSFEGAQWKPLAPTAASGFFPQAEIDRARQASVLPALNAPANAMDAGNWLVRNFGSGSGGPPQVAPQPAAPSVSPAVPNTSYQGYIPGGFDYMRQDPMTQSSRGGYPRYAGGPSLESLPNVTSFDRMIDGPPVGPQDNINTEYGRPANQAVTFPSASPMGMTSDYGTAIPRDSSSSDYGALPPQFYAPGYQPFRSGAKPSVYASAGDFSGSGGTDTLVGGAGSDRLSSAGGRLVPTSVIHGPASGDFNLGNGGPAPGGFAPVGDPANPGVVPAGDPAPPPAVDSTGLSVDDTGNPYFAGGVGPMARAPIGTQYVGAPKPKVTFADRAVPALAGMTPGIGLILAPILRSAMRTGSFDNAQSYRGPIQGRNYATLMTSGGVPALTDYGTRQYSGPNGISNSPFTPQGYTAPNFNPVSGGALYAYNPQTHTYVDSQGRTHSYD